MLRDCGISQESLLIYFFSFCFDYDILAVQTSGRANWKHETILLAT